MLKRIQMNKNRPVGAHGRGNKQKATGAQ